MGIENHRDQCLIQNAKSLFENYKTVIEMILLMDVAINFLMSTGGKQILCVIF